LPPDVRLWLCLAVLVLFKNLAATPWGEESQTCKGNDRRVAFGTEPEAVATALNFGLSFVERNCKE
jgi:hypothetical protein